MTTSRCGRSLQGRMSPVSTFIRRCPERGVVRFGNMLGGAVFGITPFSGGHVIKKAVNAYVALTANVAHEIIAR